MCGDPSEALVVVCVFAQRCAHVEAFGVGSQCSAGSRGWAPLAPLAGEAPGAAARVPAGVTLGSRETALGRAIPGSGCRTALALARCCDTTLVWLSCVLLQCFASAACIVGGVQDGVPVAECTTSNCPMSLAFGNTNLVQFTEIAISDASTQCLCDNMP